MLLYVSKLDNLGVMRLSAGIISLLVFMLFFQGISISGQIEKDNTPKFISGQEDVFTAKEIAALQSLWIGSLPPLPIDPSNAVVDNPQAVQFGKKLFSDTRFSANNKISCATCHKEEVAFSDNKPLAEGLGTSTRRGMPIIGMAYFKWFFWDGRADSLWSQALGPLENPVEHGITRCKVALLVRKHYRQEYEEIFGALPALSAKNCPEKATPLLDNQVSQKLWNDMKPEDRDAVNRVFSNVGKAIAAFERLILPAPARFDQYVEALLKKDTNKIKTIMTKEEIDGMRLFVGKGNCIKCHNGPLFADDDFHNLKVPGRLDRGRIEGIEKVIADEFNCYGKYSDAEPEECIALNAMVFDKEKYRDAFKTPTLRNVVERAPYMHSGEFKTIAKVLAFYQYPFDFDLMFEFGHSTLSDKDLEKIEAFLYTLSSPLSFP
jgi:cytochrome c peroxidase